MTPTPERIAAQLLRPATEETLALDAEQQTLAEAAVLQALAARKRTLEHDSRWRPRTWLAIAAGLATVTVGAAGWWKSSASPAARVTEVELATLDGIEAIEPGTPITEGQVLTTPARGRAAIRFDEGTKLSLGEKSSLSVQGVQRHRRFNLLQGQVSASVVKLKKDEQFEVTTSHATVSVRGTRFAVEIEPPSSLCAKGATRVSVEEGLVSVTSEGQEKLVRPGEHLRVGCEPVAVPDVAAKQEDIPVKTPRAPPPSASSLSRMNEQYAKAMKLKRAGELSAAAQVLRDLRRTYPSGPLDEAAAVEELRLLERVDVARARSTALEYLEEYPQGYARDIAHKLAEAP